MTDSQDQTKPWIGVDLDGTLAFYDGWKGPEHIGDPIPYMQHLVIEMVRSGEVVKIFTARGSIKSNHNDQEELARQIAIIQDWTEKHIGHRLEVTCEKDLLMKALYDDRAVQVVPNKGYPIEFVHDQFGPADHDKRGHSNAYGHFCHEFDGLWICEECDEFDVCTCWDR